MSRTIDYYFSIPSPWAYLGHDLFHELVARHGLSVRYRPVLLAEVFSETGGQPLSQRPKVRQHYRMVELQRWREKRNVPLNLTPKGFPMDPALVDRTIIALIQAGHSPVPFIRAAHRAVWAEEKMMSERGAVQAVLAGLLHEGLPFDVEAIMVAAEGEASAAAYAANRDAAIAAGAFGSPAYVLDGEVFWGQDRLELLADALASGRAAYRWPL